MLLDIEPVELLYIFDETIKQITNLQIDIQKKFLMEEERKRNDNYIPDSDYFKLRNSYEGIRIKKLQLIRRKNQILSYMSFS